MRVVRRLYTSVWCGILVAGLVTDSHALGADERIRNAAQAATNRSVNTANSHSTLSARLDGELKPVPYFGDLWPMTWADDDRLYAAWGDGTGVAGCIPSYNGRTPGMLSDWDYASAGNCGFVLGAPGANPFKALFCAVFDCGACMPLSPFTPAGLLALEGPVPDFAPCQGASCVVARHLPSGRSPFILYRQQPWFPLRDDKPSSLLAVKGRLYLAGHRPAGIPTEAYIAYSDDRGKTFTEVRQSPWRAPSRFLVAMMINMGRAYALNRDGYLYALAIEKELDAISTSPQPVYLWRAPSNALTDYRRYEYFSGTNLQGRPRWSRLSSAAVPVSGLGTYVTGSALFHPGIQRFLFISGVQEPLAGIADPHAIDVDGAVFAAEHPWGPWQKIGSFPGGFIASLIPKGAEGDRVYFTAAGGAVPYQLHVGQLRLTTLSSTEAPARQQSEPTSRQRCSSQPFRVSCRPTP